jgi:hypothetical protein
VHAQQTLASCRWLSAAIGGSKFEPLHQGETPDTIALFHCLGAAQRLCRYSIAFTAAAAALDVFLSIDSLESSSTARHSCLLGFSLKLFLLWLLNATAVVLRVSREQQRHRVRNVTMRKLEDSYI